MAASEEPTLSPGRFASPPAPAVDRPSSWTSSPPALHRTKRSEVIAVRNLAISGTVLGIGAAFIDTTYATASHPAIYYYGWAFLVGSFLAVVYTFTENRLRPRWGYVGMVLVGAYGWWNATWSLLTVWAGGDLDGAHGQVILANFSPIWPYDQGSVEIPFALFLVTTAVAMVIPLFVLLQVRRPRARS